MWKTALALSLAAALAACGSDKKQDPAPTTTAKPTTPAPTTPTTPAPTTPAAPKAPAATGPLSVVEKPGDASCFDYGIERGGAAVELPKAVAAALECAAMVPTLTPKRDAVVLFDGAQLSYWAPGADAKRLVLFEAGPDGVEGISQPSWSADGTRLAVVVKGAGYPEGTRLFVLTLSATGDVTGKIKKDVAVLTPCGSVCEPESVTWKDGKTVTVVPPGDGDGGPPVAIAL